MTNKERFVAFLKAYENKDLTAISGFLAPDVLLKDWNLSVRGKERALEETAKNFAAADSLKIDILSMYESPTTVAGEVHIIVNGKDHLWVVDILEFNIQGLVVGSRSFVGIPN